MESMNATQARIREIFLHAGSTGVRIETANPLRPIPGQYLLASGSSLHQVLPVALFVDSAQGTDLTAFPALPVEWTPGMEISLRGPLGNGFHPPMAVHHLALVDLSDHHGRRLLGVAEMRECETAEVVLLSNNQPEELPVEIEFLPLSALSEVIGWSDYLAVELSLQQMKTLRDLAGIRTNQEFPTFAEALIETPMICGGVASCGVCAVRVRGQWALACKEGPVFRIHQISEEE